jgi:hypothetical protein
MGAGLGFKDFTTGEVLTANDVDGYLMQGVWTFANAAARDAAVTSPQEGNMCYLKDTDAVQYYSGSAWTAVSAASASALTKIVTGTFSNVASTGTTFDGCFTSTYDNYMIIFSNMYASAGSSLRFQTRLAGATQATANYAGSYVRGATVTQTSSATSYNLMSMQNVSTQQGAINMMFYRNTTKISWTYDAVGRGSGDVNYNGAGFNDNVSANGSDGFIITADTANIYGTITVYGVSK